MENKNWRQKIIEVIKKGDSRFWLMVFVVVSTLSIFVVWSFNIKSVFSGSVKLSQDMENMGMAEVSDEVGSTFSELADVLNNIKEPEAEEKETLNDEDLNKIIEAVNSKIISAEASTTASSTVDGLENNTSSDPILSTELDESDQTVKELKKRIEELEKKLGE